MTTAKTVPVDTEECEISSEGVVEDGVELLEEYVAEGMLTREEGKLPVRQVASSDNPTMSTLELPPDRPSESTMSNMSEVPAATSTIQSNEVDPLGGCNINESPPGTMA